MTQAAPSRRRRIIYEVSKRETRKVLNNGIEQAICRTIENAAAAHIQRSWFRFAIQRRALATAAIPIQGLYRIVQSRRAAECRRRQVAICRMVSASNMICATVRQRQARKLYEQLKLQSQLAARERRQELALICIQRHARGNLERRVTDQLMVESRRFGKAASVIQSLVRRASARTDAVKSSQMQQTAALHIQQSFRGFACRSELSRKSLTASMLQHWWRSQRSGDPTKLADITEHRTALGKSITPSRKRLFAANLKKRTDIDAAAQHLDSTTYFDQEDLALNEGIDDENAPPAPCGLDSSLRLSEAATAIQAHWRKGILQGRRQRAAYTLTKAIRFTVIRLQRQKDTARQDQAATTIQSHFRRLLAKSEVRRLHENQLTTLTQMLHDEFSDSSWMPQFADIKWPDFMSTPEAAWSDSSSSHTASDESTAMATHNKNDQDDQSFHSVWTRMLPESSQPPPGCVLASRGDANPEESTLPKLDFKFSSHE